ncbi:exodeoxyribonuclease VII small subunit [Oceanospirillum linum]|uniref:Exodeoxyribonuclease 7 small subunit n=1 Tax=Oceanospirillum linum TaxID=966 RepID=A0A1T1HBK5_OCELI|nr:exodeoxyribonuclease VII small subunit [Oceanospirillum linum]OOV87248.1 exodeoxyribonuclease VII small subunit [Oceanospirillum linum]SEF78954.1 Exodeoxyribonuclease VII small subunit [Oleiphilus messinensis]SMP18285.1 Exodeoxyribonuclease VII small subunit [Oceanospirillum linum]
MAQPKAKDFAGKMAELEQLVAQLEAGELSLEESLKAFEGGIRLIRDCQNKLTQAEQKVSQLIEDNGQLTEAPLSPPTSTE